MGTRTVLVVLCACLWSAAPLAQPADPISGIWGSVGMPYLELKFDGKRTVSGTAIFRRAGQETRSPITTGTFDPQTRAFRLEGEREQPDGVKASYVIEGKVDGDTMTGTLNGVTKLSFTRLTQAQATQPAWSRFYTGPDSIPGEEFVAAINLPDKNVKATGTLFIATSVRRVRAIIVLTERGPRTPMAAQGRFGDDDWRGASERCGCGLLHFRMDTIRPIPELTLRYNVLRNAALGGGDVLLGVMDRLAKEMARPELQSAPFVFWGWSAAATFGPSFAQQHSDRTLAFIAYHAALTDVSSYLDVLKRIPALLIIGGKDTSTANAERLWTAARADDAPWAFAVEPNAPHSDEETLTASNSLMLPWITATVDTRAANDSSKLRDVELSAGWRVDHGTGQMQRYGSQGTRPSSSWLPDEESARGWQRVSGKSK
jgi:hypothetical protein